MASTRDEDNRGGDVTEPVRPRAGADPGAQPATIGVCLGRLGRLGSSSRGDDDTVDGASPPRRPDPSTGHAHGARRAWSRPRRGSPARAGRPRARRALRDHPQAGGRRHGSGLRGDPHGTAGSRGHQGALEPLRPRRGQSPEVLAGRRWPPRPLVEEVVRSWKTQVPKMPSSTWSASPPKSYREPRSDDRPWGSWSSSVCNAPQ